MARMSVMSESHGHPEGTKGIRGSIAPTYRGSLSQHLTVTVPGFNIEVLRDDGDAQLVLVFTRSTEVGGVVDPEAMIEEPMEAARKIFVLARNKKSEETMKTGFEELSNGPVKASVYQRVIRENIKNLLRDHGFFCKSETSIDNDEIDLKVLLNVDGDVIRNIAANADYFVPLKKKVYQEVKPKGSWYSGFAPPKNILGDDVPAFVPFDHEKDEKGLLEPFRRVDVLRLISHHLADWLDLNECVSQNVLSRYFYVSNYEDLEDLHDNWCDLKKCFTLPTYAEDNRVRDYFGEEIAFFYTWVAFFVRSLMILGCAGVVVHLMTKTPLGKTLGMTLPHRNGIILTYMAYAILWAIFFSETSKANMARRNQKWGMDSPHTTTDTLISYDPYLEGTAELKWRRRLHDVVWCAYMVVFVIGVAIIQAYQAHEKDHVLEGAMDYSPIILAAFMKAMQFVWSKVAPMLVYMQNWRTEGQWFDALTFSLSTINIFIGLWPGLNALFIQKFVTMRCGSSMEAVLKAVYKDKFPDGSPGLSDTTWAQPFFMQNDAGGVCMYGCYPEKCSTVGAEDALFCRTNCYEEFQTSLTSFFVVQCVLTFVFAVTPIIIVRFLIKMEQKKVEITGNSDKPYTLLQVEAKREEVAPYIYKSWGGSYEEDFMDMAVAFAVLVCFSPAVLPLMSFVGFVCFAVIYRVLAFRTSLITSRPFPTAIAGIGAWQNVFDTTILAAVVINCGCVAMTCLPFRDWSLEYQVMVFLTLENSCVFLKQMLAGMLSSDEPFDCRLARLVNVDVCQRFEAHDNLEIPAEEQANASQVYASLGLKKM